MTTPADHPARSAAADMQSETPEVGVAGNERLTALAGTVLFVLLAVETLTVVRLRGLMSLHVAVGVLLAGPLAVKLASTGFRFVRYYARSSEYVRRGPPRLPLRLLAIPLVAATIVLIGSGFALILTGPADAGPWIPLHNVSALIWFPLITVHAVAYLRRALRLTVAEWRAPVRIPASRAVRLGANVAALVLGAAGALVLLPVAAPWVPWSQVTEPVPAPLIVGAVLALVALLGTRPARWS